MQCFTTIECKQEDIATIVDIVTSYVIISNLKKEGYSNIKDITEKANEEVKKVLRNKSIFNRRLLNAFPHLKFIIKDKKN